MPSSQPARILRFPSENRYTDILTKVLVDNRISTAACGFYCKLCSERPLALEYSDESWAEMLDEPEATVARWRHELETWGYIVYGKKQKTNTVYMVILERPEDAKEALEVVNGNIPYGPNYAAIPMASAAEA